MTPVVAIVGRPNVGKSTLFNYLTRSKDALVADTPGVTRDRLYGYAHYQKHHFIAIDTGGLGFAESDPVYELMQNQVHEALNEAHTIIFMVDGQQGMTAVDHSIADHLRALGKPVVVTVNKTENIDPDLCQAEFYELGFHTVYPISATQGQGIRQIIEYLSEYWPQNTDNQLSEGHQGIKITIAGRPNVGKSTLVNRILKEERMIISDASGTTRDRTAIPLRRNEQDYVLIDTAGIRRKKQATDQLERLSIVKSLQSIDHADVVIVVIDAQDEITAQDLKLIDLAIQAGRGLVVAINKWDGLEKAKREWVRREIDRRLPFARFARIHFISALHGTGVGELFESVNEAYTSANVSMTTSQLTDLLQQAVTQHQPPLVKGRRIKLRLAHPGGNCPPRIIIHGKQTARLPDAYHRYLINYFRKALKLVGTPLRLQFKTDENPYRNT